MSAPPRLYLSGPAGCGKSALARMLQGHGFHGMSLGDACRAECRRRGWPEDRTHLQRAGDVLRTSDPAGAVLASGGLEIPGPLVVDGVRLAAEARLLRAHGFVGVALDAPPEVRAARLRSREGVPSVPDHATEREAPAVPADIRLANGGDDPGDLDRLCRLLFARLAVLQARTEARVFAGREHA